MANAKIVLFEKDADRKSEVKIKEGTDQDYNNLMPQDHGMLLTDISFNKRVAVIEVPSIVSPTADEEQFRGPVILTKYKPRDRFKGPQTGLIYQISKTPDFENIITDREVSGETDRFMPIYGELIDSTTPLYVRARYVSGDHKSDWTEPIRYYKTPTPEGNIVKPTVKIEWKDDDTVQRVLGVTVDPFKIDPPTGYDEDYHTATSYILTKEDGTPVKTIERDEVNKNGIKITDGLEPGTTYKLKVIYHSVDFGDSEPTEYTFKTADHFVQLPTDNDVTWTTPDGTVLNGTDIDELIKHMSGDFVEGYFGKIKTQDRSVDRIYRYVGEYNPDLNIFAATRDPSTGTPDYKLDETAYFKDDYISKEDKLYEVLQDALPADPLDGEKFKEVSEDKLMFPNYGTVLSLLAAINVYDRDEFTEEQLKYLCDFDYNGLSGKHVNSQSTPYVFKYDPNGKSEVTAYFYPEKKDDEEQALREGNEYYCFVKDGVVKYVSTTYFKYVSPMELGMVHLVGEGRTIRVGHNLYRVTIMTKEDVDTFTKVFNGELANEIPTYNDKGNEKVLDIVKRHKSTLYKYEYHQLGRTYVKNFSTLSARLLEDTVEGVKYYPSYRIVLEHIHPDDEPWKGDKLAELNKDEHIENYNTIDKYNKFLDVGFYLYNNNAYNENTLIYSYPICKDYPICTKQFGFNTQGQEDGPQTFLHSIYIKCYYHGINVYYFTNITLKKIEYQEVTDLGYLSMYPSYNYRETKLIKGIEQGNNFNSINRYIAAIPSNRKYLINNHVKKSISQENNSIIFNKNVNRSISSEVHMYYLSGYSSQFGVFNMYSSEDTAAHDKLIEPYSKFNSLEYTNRSEMKLGKGYREDWNTEDIQLMQFNYNLTTDKYDEFNRAVGGAVLTNNLCASDDDGTQHYQNQVGTSADNCVVKKITSGNTNGYIGSAYHDINTNSIRTAPHYYVTSTPRLKTKTDNLTAEDNDQFFRKHNLQCVNMVLRLLTVEQTQEIEEFNEKARRAYQSDYAIEIETMRMKKKIDEELVPKLDELKKNYRTRFQQTEQLVGDLQRGYQQLASEASVQEKNYEKFAKPLSECMGRIDTYRNNEKNLKKRIGEVSVDIDTRVAAKMGISLGEYRRRRSEEIDRRSEEIDRRAEREPGDPVPSRPAPPPPPPPPKVQYVEERKCKKGLRGLRCRSKTIRKIF